MSPHWLKQHHLHLSSVQNPFLLPLYWLVDKDSPSGSLYSPRWWSQSSSNRGFWTLLTWRDSKCRLLVAWWYPKPRWPRCWGRPCTSRFTQRHSYQFEPPSYHDRSRSQYDGDTSWLMISYWCYFLMIDHRCFPMFFATANLGTPWSGTRRRAQHFLDSASLIHGWFNHH